MFFLFDSSSSFYYFLIHFFLWFMNTVSLTIIYIYSLIFNGIRRDELTELLALPDYEEILKDGDYSIQVRALNDVLLPHAILMAFVYLVSYLFISFLYSDFYLYFFILLFLVFYPYLVSHHLSFLTNNLH